MEPMAEKVERKPRAKRPSVRAILTQHHLGAGELEVRLVKLAARVRQHERIAKLIEARQKADAKAADRKAAYNEAADEAETAGEAVLAAYRKLDEIAGDEDAKAMPLFEDKLKGKTGPPEDKGDDSWRLMNLADLEDPAIPAGVLTCLERADIRTLGDLAGHYDSLGQLQGVKGAGEVAQAKVEAAVDAFWQRRQAAAVPTGKS